jgi:nucleoside-diphosphate-sugar epimerase
MDYLSPWRGKRVLVTGGTGFIGQHVLALGITAGVEIHNLALDGQIPTAVIGHRVDLQDGVLIKQIIQAIQPEAVIHLAAAGVSYGARDLADMLRANAIGTENLLAAVDSVNSVRAMVVAGTGYEYAMLDRPILETDPIAPSSDYGVSKAAASLCASIHARRRAINLLRLFNVYGPGEREPRLLPYIVACARIGRKVELTAGEQIRDYLYVGDVAECFWRTLALPAATAGLQVFNVGSGTSVELRTFVGKIIAELRTHGFDPQIELGARPYRPDEPMFYAADITRLHHALGWSPDTSLEEGIRLAVESML